MRNTKFSLPTLTYRFITWGELKLPEPIVNRCDGKSISIHPLEGERGIYQIFVYPRRLSLGSTFWWKKGLPPSLSLSSDLISASLCEGQLLPAFAPQEQPQSRPALASVPHFLLFSCAISPILNSLLPASRLNQIYPLPFGELLPGICRDSLWFGPKILVFFVFSVDDENITSSFWA